MDRKHVIELLQLLGAEQIKDSSDWVSCACPFAPWTHSKGHDTKPSFGVNIGRRSYYHCFACGRSGPLPMLVTGLCMYAGRDNVAAREYVMRHEDLSLEPFEDLDKDPEPLTPLAPALMKKFGPAHEGLEIVRKRGISEATIKKFNLLYDTRERRLIFPIFDAKGQLVGFRGRAANGEDKLKYREYSELCPKKQSLKGHGIWYGMQFKPPVDKKIILVEGEMDAIKLVQVLAMRDGVWAAMGASISEEQIRVIQALKNPVVLFFDNDEAGIEAKRKMVRKLAHVKTGIFEVYDYRGRKDPDELVTAGQLKKALESLQQIG